jgi:hypothetical protein
MEIISPINAETCRSYVGKPVCAVLHDGSRYYGYVHGVEDGRLLLSYEPQAAVTSAKKKSKNKKKASTQAFFGPYGYGGLFALDLALIALLFALPFLWW